MTYVIGDIHGCYDLFIKMLDKIEFSDSDTLWILGDVVDRGKESIKTLLHIIQSDNIHMILGNHEEFMLDFFKRNNMPTIKSDFDSLYYNEMWFRNGGKETVRELIDNYSEQIAKIILEWLNDRPLIKELHVGDNKFYLAHANLQFNNCGDILLMQDRDFVLWKRRFPSDKDVLKENTYLLTGHTPTHNFKDTTDIFRNHNWFCIDCGSVFTWRLGCLRLDDFKEFYVNR